MKVSPAVVALVLSFGSWTGHLLAQQAEPPPGSPPVQAPAKPAEAVPPEVMPRLIGRPTIERQKNAQWNVMVDVQMIALPQELALVFMADLRSDDDAKVNAAIEQLQDLLKKKQALLLGWPRTIGAEGERVTAENIVEQRYPTAWDAAILVKDTPPAAPPNTKTAASLSPIEFETRNIGVTLEVEPTVLNDGKEIVLSLVAQRVSLLEFKRFNLGRTKDDQPVYAEQPQFTTSKVTTTLKVRSGQSILVGTHLLTKPENHVEFVIARAVTVKMR